MPLPTDQKLLALSQDLIEQFDTLFGLHPGFRPAHPRALPANQNNRARLFNNRHDYAAALLSGARFARSDVPITRSASG